MARELKIGNTLIGDDTDCYVIAEIGQNHQGDIKIAKELFDQAKACGASAVKLQKRTNDKLFTKEMMKMPYENPNSFGPTYGEHRMALELNRDQYLELKEHATQLGLDFFSTPWDFDAVDFLMDIGVPVFKTASADLVNTPLLEYIAQQGKPMIISTGGSTMADVERAVAAVSKHTKDFCVLQCTSSYPAQPEEMNLKVIETYREKFPDTVIGLSDHQDGIAMAILAYAYGARVFEKHFTLHRSMKGTDHACSLESGGLRRLVRDLQRARVALGDGEKRMLESEVKPMIKLRKKIVAARDLKAGDTVAWEDLAFKCPGDGMPPAEYEALVGKPLTRDMAEDDAFSPDCVGG